MTDSTNAQIPKQTTDQAPKDIQTTELESLKDFIEEILKECADETQATFRQWFRGQPKAHYDLVPGIYRNDFVGDGVEEADRLNKERLQAKEFSIQSASLLQGNESDEQIYFLMQHYGMPTRLLDWTSNALMGLFFAVRTSKKSNNDLETDGKLFYMDAYVAAEEKEFKNNEGNNQVFKGIASRRHLILKNALKPIFDWDDDLTKFPNFIFPVVPHRYDRRIILQRGFFTFHVPTQPKLTPEINSTLKAYLVKAENKKVIRNQLQKLGIDAFSAYGDLPNLSETLKSLKY